MTGTDVPVAPDVAAVFDFCDPDVRRRLLFLRQVILETAKETGVGNIEETLKWGHTPGRSIPGAVQRRVHI